MFSILATVSHILNMSRIARLVVPKCPHHIIQRGNRRQRVFFNDSDREFYLKLLYEHALRSEFKIWAYCLMDNHVHLIVVPTYKESLAKGISEIHRKYTGMINRREKWTGYLWQGRFLSYPLDEPHAYAAVRYVENNPVKAGIVEKAEDYLWSSARAHVFKRKDCMLDDNYLTKEEKNWSDYLNQSQISFPDSLFKSHSSTGRPLGSKAFLHKLEALTGIKLIKSKPGPKGHPTKNLISYPQN